MVASITDILMNTFAMESSVLRARKITESGRNADNAYDMSRVFSAEVMDIVESSARNVLAASSEGDALRMNLSVLKRFAKSEPVDVIGLRRRIAGRLIAADRYTV